MSANGLRGENAVGKTAWGRLHKRVPWGANRKGPSGLKARTVRVHTRLD